MSYFDDSESLEWHRQKWEKMHKRGAAFFVLLAGVPVYGALPFILITCWDILVDHEQMDPFFFALGALFWLLHGLYWGAQYIGILAKSAICARRKQEDSVSRNQFG